MTPEQWDQLVDLLGSVSQEVYQVAARQAAIEAWAAFALWLFSLVVLVVWSLTMKHYYDRDDDDHVIMVLVAGLVPAVMAMFGILALPSIFFNYWVNPEWSILKTLSSLITG